MPLRSAAALFRAAWLTATSYRLGIVFAFAGLLFSCVPLYYVANAMQPLMESSISEQGGNYFAFVIVGMAATFLVSAAVTAVSGAIAAAVGSGTFEAMLVTRTPLYQTILGMTSYSILWNLLRGAVLVAFATIFGMKVVVANVPPTLLVFALLITVYFGLGLIGGALILAFRTAGPFTAAVVTVSGLLGGVYYSTDSIPSWIKLLSEAVPLTYALRASRMLLAGSPFSEVSSDVVLLAGMTAVSVAVGLISFWAALRYARRAGTLAQY